MRTTIEAKWLAERKNSGAAVQYRVWIDYDKLLTLCTANQHVGLDFRDASLHNILQVHRLVHNGGYRIPRGGAAVPTLPVAAAGSGQLFKQWIDDARTAAWILITYGDGGIQNNQ